MEARRGVCADVVIILLFLMIFWVSGWGDVWCACLVTQMVDDCRFLCWVYVSSFVLDILAFCVVVDVLVFVSSSSLETWSRI